jgi:hypothetical protein
MNVEPPGRPNRIALPDRADAIILLVCGGLLAGPFAAPAGAHEARRVGPFDLVVGWANEPAYAGFGNEVFLSIEERGRPEEDADLDVVVAFGGRAAQARSEPMPMDPAFDRPGEYLAYVIPTRPGRYSFHITGTIEGLSIDETFTSGDDTFDDVSNPADIEFPAQDPTRGEIAERLDRLDARIESLRPAKQPAERGTDPALWIAIGAGVLALIAVVLAARRRTA